MKKDSKILVAGAAGMVGSSIVRNLISKGYTNVLGTFRNRKSGFKEGAEYFQIDFLDQQATANFFSTHKPEYVFLAAAKVGGIVANNDYRADFIYNNLQIQNNIIHQSYKNNIKKLMFLGSSCIYPRNAPQPMSETDLLTGELEYTNEPYALAKIAGIRLCESYNLQYATNYIAAMPTNLYGPLDNFDLEKSHVLPALIRKIYISKCLENNQIEKIYEDFKHLPFNGYAGEKNLKELLNILDFVGINKNEKNQKVSLKLWGSGQPMREFLHSNDLADACVHLMENVDFKDIVKAEYGAETIADTKTHKVRNTHINIGTGKDIAIKELALLIQSIAGFGGNIEWDTSKPDGTPKKLLNINKLKNYGWQPKINFKQSIKTIYKDYTESKFY